MLRKGDIIVIAVILAVGLLWWSHWTLYKYAYYKNFTPIKEALQLSPERSMVIGEYRFRYNGIDKLRQPIQQPQPSPENVCQGCHGKNVPRGTLGG